MLLEILKIGLPSLIVFIATYYVLRTCLKSNTENKRIEIVLQNQKLITPIRLQAYERIILFLERISPNSVILRLQTPNMTVQQLHRDMLIIIRTEYEHNLSQQLYLSAQAWEQVKNAKEHTIKLINSCSQSLSQDDDAIKLSQAIFDNLIKLDKSPSQEAIDYIKEEVKVLF